ncbi:orotidine-5'-phosphate decarboxylase [Pelagicoccus sp. SDUM812003]|uniref:orotidine-5'-phosphate decarboxylase n=1 Tax=Pelagicoccus sp. SDUM812003 TaxID=3041267 RepID=UPI00280F8562|nr:orotidine-5'-phosphate decarboxylase [Pelagicoccus sp. SDUM812003]MDQ8203016.1 orotidine-5'-phosphate decarboxylase [Pelagicoccus sp. SDUM812003]
MSDTNQSKNACELILALDIEDRADALDLLEKAGPELRWAKIGLQMFTKYGPDYVRQIADLGVNVFLDLKLHDIPNTVAKAVESVGKLPIQMLTIHTCGGKEMMEWAVKAQENINPNLQLLGVTVLTSMDQSSLDLLGIQQTPADRVAQLASLAKDAGMSGLVCSTHEVQTLRAAFGNHFTLVTPGVRPTGSAAGDQKRIMTPAQAREVGSNFIVVGRPIYGAEDPAAVVASINAELQR